MVLWWMVYTVFGESMDIAYFECWNNLCDGGRERVITEQLHGELLMDLRASFMSYSIA